MPTHSIVLARSGLTSLHRKIAWRIIPFLMLCCLMNYIDRQNIGFSKLAFTKDIGISEAQYGLGGGLFYFGYLLSEIPNNMLVHRYGFKASLSRIIFIWGFVCVGMGLITSPNQFLTARFLLGVAEGGFFPGVLLYMACWIPASLRAKFTAMYFVAASIAGIVGGPVAGAIMQGMDGAAGLANWRWLFIIEGIPTVLLGVLCYFVIVNRPADAAWLSATEKSALEAELASETSQTGKPKFDRIKAVFGQRSLYALLGMSFATYSSSVGLFLWIPSYIRKSGVTTYWEIGLLSAIPFIVAAFTQILNGIHADRAGEQRWHVAVPALVAASGWALLSYTDAGAIGAIVMLTLVAAGTLGAQTVFYTMPATFMAGSAAAFGIATVTTVGAVGGVLSPAAIGWLNDNTHSFAAGQAYLSVVMALASALLLLRFPKRRADFANPASGIAGQPDAGSR